MLYTKRENGRYAPATVAQIAEAHARWLAQGISGASMGAPADAVQFLQAKYAHEEREVFACLLLDTRHHLIGEVRELFWGTVDGATIYPREVVKLALRENASAIILCHNHPSGIAEPSEADRSITHKLRQALTLVEVRLLDHIIVARMGHVSMAERGLI